MCSFEKICRADMQNSMLTKLNFELWDRLRNSDVNKRKWINVQKEMKIIKKTKNKANYSPPL